MLVRGHGLTRPGAMRALTEQTVVSDPDLLAVSEIDDGDALALATKTDRQWSYRGGQALFWRAGFVPLAVHEAYLSSGMPRLPWRGLLRADLRVGTSEISLLCMRLAPDRRGIADLRFVRKMLRDAAPGRAILCVANPPATGARAFAQLGFDGSNCAIKDDVLMAIRGGELRSCVWVAGGEALGTQIVAHVRV